MHFITCNFFVDNKSEIIFFEFPFNFTRVTLISFAAVAMLSFYGFFFLFFSVFQLYSVIVFLSISTTLT